MHSLLFHIKYPIFEQFLALSDAIVDDIWMSCDWELVFEGLEVEMTVLMQ